MTALASGILRAFLAMPVCLVPSQFHPWIYHCPVPYLPHPFSSPEKACEMGGLSHVENMAFISWLEDI